MTNLETLLLAMLGNKGGGGEGGTTNYNELDNRPQVNGITLTGNKDSEDLNLVDINMIGVSCGIAALDADGKVPQSQLPTPVAQKEYKLTETTSESYAKSYKLQVKDGETWSDVSESATINIPKDMVVESGSVKECTADNVPVSGYKKGDKYIDLVIANKTDAHIYINVKDLIDNKAEGIQYSNTTSKLTATNVQSAIDEIAEMLADKVDETELSSAIDGVKTNLLSTIVASSNASASNAKTLEFQGTGKNLEKLVVEGKTSQDGTPSPNNPIEVKGVGDRTDNPFDFNDWLTKIATVGVIGGSKEISNGTLKLTATGEDCYTSSYGLSSSPTIPVKPNTDYVLSWETDSSNTGAVYVFEGVSSNIIGRNSSGTTNLVKFNSGSVTRVAIRFGVRGTGKVITFSNATLIEGGKPYKIPISVGSKSTNIYLDQPLYNNDSLDTEKSTVYSARKLVTYNGTENWQIGKDLTTYFRFDIALPVSAANGPSCVSSYCSWSNAENQTTHFNIPDNKTLTVYINKNDANSLDEWKAMLANNPLMVVYTRQNAIEESFDAPEIATVVGKNTLTLGTDVTPSKIEVTSFGEYYSKAEVDKMLAEKADKSIFGDYTILDKNAFTKASEMPSDCTLRDECKIRYNNLIWTLQLHVISIGNIEANTWTPILTTTSAPGYQWNNVPTPEFKLKISRNDNTSILTHDAKLRVISNGLTDGEVQIYSPVKITTGRINASQYVIADSQNVLF